MRSFKLIVFALLIGIPSFAQQARTRSNHSIHANLSIYNFHAGLGYTYEWAFAPKWTLLGSAWFKGEWNLLNANYYNVYGKNPVAFIIHPTISAEPRFYYNFMRRESKGRSTALNSGSYLGITASCFFPSIYGSNGVYRNFFHYGISPHWGMRRVYQNKMFLEFHAGIYILMSPYETIAGPDVNFKFGYVF